jgi:hypothetical protein
MTLGEGQDRFRGVAGAQGGGQVGLAFQAGRKAMQLIHVAEIDAQNTHGEF